MLLAGLQDVGHEDVATGRGAFSLRSLNEALQHYGNPASEPRSSGHKHSLFGEEHPLRASVLCSSLLGKALQYYSKGCTFFTAIR